MKHVGSPAAQAQLVGLATLLQLIKRARNAATAEEFGFIAVNETHSLLPYRQAVLWRSDNGAAGAGVAAISGTPVIDPSAPFVSWLNRAMAALDRQGGDARPVGSRDLANALGEEWAEWLPAHALWLPLKGPDGPLGALLLAREDGWDESEGHLLQELADGYAHAWRRFGRGGRWLSFGKLRSAPTLARLAALAAVSLLLLVPVRLSALAPAEVVALEPTVVRAPLEGVVDELVVKPNAVVQEGQLLLKLDPRTLENKRAVAAKALDVAETEYRQTAQQALFDEKSRAQLAVVKGRIDQRRTELTYIQSLLGRINVHVARAGIAVFSDPAGWIGKPVSLGERLLEIADPASVEVEIWLGVADAINVEAGAPIEFFLNITPDAPLRAVLRQASYEAVQSPAGALGYRLKATLDAGTLPPRIGLRGTAKIYGERVTLFYYLVRRPFAAARQFLGW
ncbi:MAG: efflux RND transporter periplasmic adaptor subunit [Pseudolabrys sp.]